MRNDTSTKGTSDTESTKPELIQRFVHIALTIAANTKKVRKFIQKFYEVSILLTSSWVYFLIIFEGSSGIDLSKPLGA